MHREIVNLECYFPHSVGVSPRSLAPPGRRHREPSERAVLRARLTVHVVHARQVRRRSCGCGSWELSRQVQSTRCRRSLDGPRSSPRCPAQSPSARRHRRARTVRLATFPSTDMPARRSARGKPSPCGLYGKMGRVTQRRMAHARPTSDAVGSPLTRSCSTPSSAGSGAVIMTMLPMAVEEKCHLHTEEQLEQARPDTIPVLLEPQELRATASASNQQSCIHQWRECGMSCDANGNCLRKFECRVCGLKKTGTRDKTSMCQKCHGSAKLISEDCDFGASGSGSISECYKCSECSHEWKVVVDRWSAQD